MNFYKGRRFSCSAGGFLGSNLSRAGPRRRERDRPPARGRVVRDAAGRVSRALGGDGRRQRAAARGGGRRRLRALRTIGRPPQRAGSRPAIWPSTEQFISLSSSGAARSARREGGFSQPRALVRAVSELPVAETHPMEPLDIYAVHKAAASAITDLPSRHGLRTTVLRIPTVWPRAAADGANTGGDAMVHRRSPARRSRIYGDGTPAPRRRVHRRRDRCLPRGGGDGGHRRGGLQRRQWASASRLVEVAHAIVGSPDAGVSSTPVAGARGADRNRGLRADVTKLGKAVDWRPRIGLDDGLARRRYRPGRSARVIAIRLVRWRARAAGRSQVVRSDRARGSGLPITLISSRSRATTAPNRGVSDGARARADLTAAGVRWRPLRYHKRPTLPATLWDIGAGVMRLLGLRLTGKLRVVHARGYVAGLMAWLVKKLTRTKFVFDMRGFWPEERVDGGLWRADSRIFRVVKGLERRFCATRIGFVVLTDRARLGSAGAASTPSRSCRRVSISSGSVPPSCVGRAHLRLRRLAGDGVSLEAMLAFIGARAGARSTRASPHRRPRRQTS